jgi:type VI secretion system protein ImpG
VEKRFLELYNQELQFLREMGSEFAQIHPKVAARLGLEELECSDPYVERLLEGFAFLTARVQLKLDAQYPQFTQHLIEYVYPGMLSPVPSCLIAEFSPAREEGSLQAGFTIPRGSAIRTALAKGERTACEFRTASPVELWPIEITEARYVTGSGALNALGIESGAGVRAAIRLRLRTFGGASFASLPIDRLPVHLKAEAPVANALYEELTSHCVGMIIREADSAVAGPGVRGGRVLAIGFDDDEALLAASPRGFPGYRLLAEYFTLPERFLFVALESISGGLKKIPGGTCEIMILLDLADAQLDGALDARQFRLFCAPAANLFPKTLDRMTVQSTEVEQHLVADRNRPLDFEVASIEKVTSIGAGGERLAIVPPLYRVQARPGGVEQSVFHTVQRRARLLSSKAERTGGRTGYLGSECFISLSQAADRDAGTEARQLEVEALCTNRDLPILLRLGAGTTDFTIDGAAPVDRIKCITGPTPPRLSSAFGGSGWKLVSHLAVNILSLSERDSDEGAELLRRLLTLYANPQDPSAARRIEAVRQITHRPVVRRIPGGGPISFGRGIAIELTVDEMGFEGAGAVVMAAVLERFFARYVSLNSFTELRLRSTRRGELRNWTPRGGTRSLL